MALDLTTFADLFTFSRSGTATYLDSNGVLQTAADGVARTSAYRYVGGVLTGPALRLESAAATNLVTYSEDFTDASWAKDNSSITANIAVAPDGATTADKILEDSSTALHVVRQVYSATAGTTYSISKFAKADERELFVIGAYSTTPNVASAVFDLTNGDIEVAAHENGNIVDAVSATIDRVGDYYRCTLTFTSTFSQNLSVFSGPTLRTTTVSDATDYGYAGDGSSGLIIWGAQRETGSIPTSYIPTSGATATRSAETLTIAAADMPDYQTPTYIGAELVTNGTFDTDLSGWTASDATIAFNSGQLELTYSAFSQRLTQTGLSLTEGNVYAISFDITPNTSVNAGGTSFVRLGGSGGGTANISPTTGVTSTIDLVLVAGATSDFEIFTYLSSGTYLLDNVSVREINPLSVCFQMSGTMNYADEGATPQEELILWQADFDNRLYVYMNTNSTKTGEMTFLQREEGTQDFVQSAADALSPGINVPFNIASRHGSNFVNGAVGGTALTENSTPTAIADLSTADFEIGPTFNGHIDQLLIWNQDIGDTGIAESSS